MKTASNNQLTPIINCTDPIHPNNSCVNFLNMSGIDLIATQATTTNPICFNIPGGIATTTVFILQTNSSYNIYDKNSNFYQSFKVLPNQPTFTIYIYGNGNSPGGTPSP